MALTRRFRGVRIRGLVRPNRRRDVDELLAAPTERLLCIKRKSDAGDVLSHAERTVVAPFAQHAVEASPIRPVE